MKPNFETMTREELRAYVLENREDDEALAALINRRDPNAVKYTTNDPEEIKEILRKKIAGEI
ncbi:hypothetical protein IQ250_19780 [Pseudanabaenaceae cyanobacterium LEGE 13415]|nr:hypothetical protein [Pseudanabaenaceae cyanobacterium LEGE 13415]